MSNKHNIKKGKIIITEKNIFGLSRHNDLDTLEKLNSALCTSEKNTDLTDRINSARSILPLAVKRYGRAKGDINDALVALDRRVAAVAARLGLISDINNFNFYYTEKARKIAERWVSKNIVENEKENRCIAVKYSDFCDKILNLHIHKHMQYYGHKVAVGENHEPKILMGGQLRNWSEIDWDGCEYLEDGLVKHDPVNWENLAPIKILPPEERPENHILEVVTDCPSNKIGRSGYHSWIRLINPQGEVYSVGFFPYEGFKRETGDRIFESVQGNLRNADMHEWLGQEKDMVCSLPISIDENQFNAIKENIENQQKNKNDLIFNLVNKNCTRWVLDILKEIGIEINGNVAAYKIIFPRFLSKIFQTISRITPNFIKTLFRPLSKLRNFICNVFLVLLCGSSKGKNGKRLISSFSEFFEYDKTMYFCHPYALRKWQEKVLENRCRNEERLKEALSKCNDEIEKNKIEENLRKNRYALEESLRNYNNIDVL